MSNSTLLIELPYLGNIQYYSKLISYPTVCIEQHEHYRKGSFRNRCCLATANGILELSIPLLKGKNRQMPIREVQIDHTQDWQLMHWRSIRTAYGNAPFFEFYEHDLKAFYTDRFDLLFDFNWLLQNKIIELLGLPNNLTLSESYQHEVDEQTLDLRHQLRPKNYKNPDDLHFSPTAYPQVFQDRHGFLPNLSILDLLFCAGPEAYSYLLASFQNQ